MSWGTCYSGSNNIHYNFPPIMTDGRIFSSWQPDAVINENIQKQENIHSNWSYRQYMTNNGLQIMKYNNLEACNLLGLPTHFNYQVKIHIYINLLMIQIIQVMDIIIAI